MSTVIHSLSRTAIVAGTALLLLSGCTPGTPTPTASPTAEASASPTPTPTVEPISAPEPRVDLTCDELGAALPLAASLVQAVTSVSPAETEYGAYPARPEEYVVRSVGGLVCEFSNGQSQSGVLGSTPTYVGVRILVLPDPGAQWDRYVDYYSVPGTRDSYCVAESLGSTCYFNGLGGGRWVDTVVVGATDDLAGMAVIEAAFTAIATAGPGAAAWTPPADTLALPDACDAYVSPAQLQAATGLSTPLATYGSGGGGWSLRGGAQAIDGSPSCFWAFEFADAGIGTLDVLRGGAWAWAEAQDIVASAPITVAGLDEGDEAWLRCGPSDAWCVVDLVLGGNWIELHLWEDDPGEPLNRRTAIQDIAAVVVANVTP
jgi:hypothetical protein